jgi:uncharacterized protein with gpF-like domain
MSEISVIPADSFEAFRDLLAILARPPKTTRLLNELERRMADVKAGEAKLAAAREAHDQKVARDLASIEEKASRLRAKEIALMGRESLAERTLEREKADRLDRSRPLANGMTITQEQP